MIAMITETVGLLERASLDSDSFDYSFGGTGIELLDFIEIRKNLLYISNSSQDSVSSGLSSALESEVGSLCLFDSPLSFPLLVENMPYYSMTSLEAFSEDFLLRSTEGHRIGLYVISAVLLSSERSSEEIIRYFANIKSKAEILIGFERPFTEYLSLESLYKAVERLSEGRNLYSEGASQVVPFPFIVVEKTHLRDFFNRFSDL